jgi:putative oxidoreductase
MVGYCGITALLWKQFWKPGDFWSARSSRAHDLFWDFLKDFSLAGGFLVITFGTDAGQVGAFLSHPELSSRPYAAHQAAH